MIGVESLAGDYGSYSSGIACFEHGVHGVKDYSFSAKNGFLGLTDWVPIG
jgi:hypothetical protein